MTAPLPPPVEAVLARVAPVLHAPAERARAAIARTLTPVTGSIWPEVAHSFSRLTNTGMPIEFAWSSRGAALRWTAEVAPPETPESERLDVAARATGLDIDWTPWRRAQAAGHLQYGAWIGMRHGADGDVAKVYVELPDGLPPSWRPPHALLRAEGLVWRMAGLSEDSGVELYARGELDADALSGFESYAFGSQRLLGAIVSLIGSPSLPRPSGFSIAHRHDGAIRALTWFVFAKALFRDDATTQAALLRMTDSPLARSLHVALAAGAADPRWRHGMVGVGVDAAGTTWLQAGVRP
jgi:hypothetical protein